jgi:hypothetical protein
MNDQQPTPPTPDEWRKLYEVAGQVKALTPWEWMFEDEIFGVQDPETSVTGFVSVMGAAGEHMAVALYQDAGALYDFLALHDEAEDEGGGDPMMAMRVIEIPQVQASFEDNKELEKEDKAVIKQLGLKFRGAKAWPKFRSYAPGLFPWFISGAEARRLTTALEQLLDVAPRCRENEDLLAPDEDGTVFLVRVPRSENSTTVWEDQIQKIEEPEPDPIMVPIDEPLLEQAQALRHVQAALELEFTMMPMPTSEKKDERPFFPYLLLIADSGSGALLGTEMLQPLPSVLEMYARLPQLIVDLFLRLEAVPQVLRVRNELAAELLEPLAEELRFTLELVDELPAIDEAMEMMSKMMPGF